MQQLASHSTMAQSVAEWPVGSSSSETQSEYRRAHRRLHESGSHRGGQVHVDRRHRNYTIAVSIAINTFTITPTAGSSATTTPGMPQTVNDGGILAFAITPNAGYHILNVLVDGVPVDAVTSYPFTNVTANHTISATFALIVPTISITSPTAGTIWPTGSTQSLAWTLSPAVSDDGDARFLELVSDNGLAVSALTRGARRTNLLRDSEERGAE